MPEGDSVRNVAARLGPLLLGHALERFVLRDRGEIAFLAGRRVQSIDVVGKHMMVGLEPDWVLRVHLGMKGRWGVYAPGQRWRYPNRDARVVLQTAERTVVCFRAPTAELTRARDPRLRDRIGALGPDVLAADFEPALATARARRFEGAPIATVLLDQRVAAGVGNVYRSELLFLTGIHPRTRVADIDDTTLTALFAEASELMRANLGPGPRSTTDDRRGARHWVYRRKGLPCLRCGSTIERDVLGDLARSVYLCPRCQPRREG